MCMSKQCQCEDCTPHPLCYYITCTRSSLSCLVASLYSTLFNSENFFIYLSPFLFFTTFACMLCNKQEINLGHKAHTKISISGLRLRKGKKPIGTTFPEAVCCLQTCNFCFGELLSWNISVPSFIVIGSSTSKLWA